MERAKQTGNNKRAQNGVSKSSGPSGQRASRNREKRGNTSFLFDRLLPLFAGVAAFAVVVLLYYRILPPPSDDVVTGDGAGQLDIMAAPAPQAYNGVSDTWLASAVYTTGNKDLDAQVKQFCDALSSNGSTAQENARVVFNTILTSEYDYRAADEQYTGTGWEQAAASHYFSGGDPARGLGGTGDEYEFSAVIMYCLRYFGYSDALAIPVVGETALVVVTDEYGRSCVCDPRMGESGWMLPRDSYDIVVANIGQDLTAAQAMGLTIQSSEDEDDTTNAKSGTSAGLGASASSSDSSSSDTDSDSGSDSDAYSDTDSDSDSDADSGTVSGVGAGRRTKATSKDESDNETNDFDQGSVYL